MVPLRVYLKNFLCHDEQEFLFDGHAVWLLHGPNGVGKSAIFDAMVYALFGQHQRSDVISNSGVDLIRHGQTSFRVEFDFEYAGRRYRVWRTRSKNTTTQGASELIDGAPQPVRDVNRVKELDRWVLDTLGLTYGTFVSAVLLRQGAAEKLIDAKKDDRREMFRGIIDLDRFIKLHTAITDARTVVGREARSLQLSLERLPLVADEQLAAATAQRDAAVTAWENAQTTERAANERLGHSRLWEQWSKDCRDIRRELEAAAGRAARAADLQRTVARLTLVREGIASLAGVASRRSELSAAQSELERLKVDCEQVKKLAELDRRIAEATAATDRLRAEIRQAQLRQELKKRREDLSSFEADLDDQSNRANQAVDEARAAKDAVPYLEALARHRVEYGQAVREEQSATEAETSAESEIGKQRVAESDADLAAREAEDRKTKAEQAHAVATHASTEASARRDRFATVAEAVRCSECGQPIDADHAVRERAKLDQAVRAAAEAVEKCRDDLAVATSAATDKKTVYARRQEEHRQAKTSRDNAKRAREQAAKRRKDARASFDRNCIGLTAEYSQRVAPIDGDGFPSSTDVDTCNSLKSRLTGLVQEQDRIRRRMEDRNKAASDVETLQKAVTGEGPPTDATAASAEVQRLEADLTALREERQQIDKVRTASQNTKGTLTGRPASVADELNRLSTEVGRADSVAANAQTQLDEAIQRVPDAFRAHLSENAFDTSELAEELRALEATGAECELAAMAADRALQADRERQLEDLEQKTRTVPEDARLPVAQAQASLTAAGKALQASDQSKSEAITQLTTLTGQRADRVNTENRLAVEERSHTLHQRLADLLGEKGIQLDLVRDAERRIVEFANDVLGRVSCGDLRIDPPDPTGDRAFDLTVRRVGCAGPIAAANLSGGQRFRLAVSLALAVCRFANGERRPLESVIVDEGFGSLDREGRMAMIDELRDGQTLRELFKRVLIVSHQDDFASAFPVGYWLRSEDGVTVAEPFGPR